MVYILLVATLLGSQVMIQTDRDTYSNATYPNESYGSEVDLFVEYSQKYGYFHFIFPETLYGADIQSIDLEIDHFGVVGYGDIDCYAVEENWLEYYLNWNNQPAWTDTICCSFPCDSNDGQFSAEGCQYVENRLAEQESMFSLALKAPTAAVGMWTREHTFGMRLTIQYEPETRVEPSSMGQIKASFK